MVTNSWLVVFRCQLWLFDLETYSQWTHIRVSWHIVDAVFGISSRPPLPPWKSLLIVIGINPGSIPGNLMVVSRSGLKRIITGGNCKFTRLLICVVFLFHPELCRGSHGRNRPFTALTNNFTVFTKHSALLLTMKQNLHKASNYSRQPTYKPV